MLTVTPITEVQQHPDGLVYVRTPAATYADTAANVALDFGVTLPLLPDGVDDRIYVPGVRHALMSTVSGLVDGGPMPWGPGDQLIANVATALVAQFNRQHPPPTLAQAQATATAAIEAQFLQRAKAPITFPVGGVNFQWAADNEAMQNIMGVVLMIASGVAVPDPRPWTPTGSFTPVQLSHANLIGLGTAIAARKDTLFAVKKQKQSDVAALTDVTAVTAYDVTAGWPSVVQVG